LKKSRLGGKVGRIVVCQRVPIYIEMPKVKAITPDVPIIPEQALFSKSSSKRGSPTTADFPAEMATCIG
jgi:hypothetical protein